MQGKVMAIVGGLLAVLVILISAAVNARYGMSLAREGFDQQVMMAVAVFADLGKAVAWVFLLAAIAKRQWLSSLAAAVVFFACLTYAVGGSVGYVASLRAQSSAVIADKAGEVVALDAAIARKRQERDKLGTVTPASVVKKQIEAKRQDARFSSSERCAKATAAASRTFCTELAELEGDELKALEAERIERELATLATQRTTYRGTARVEKGDYQGALIAHLTQWDVSNIQLGLALLFVVVVEGGACFMLGLALNHWTTAKDAQAARRAEASVVMHGPASSRRSVEYNDGFVDGTPALIETTPAPLVAPVATATTDGEAASDVNAAPAKGNVVALRDLEAAHPRHFVEFAERRLEITAQGRLNIEAMKSDYTTWAARSGRAVLDEERLDRTISLMCSDLRLERDGDMLKGVRLKSSRRRA